MTAVLLAPSEMQTLSPLTGQKGTTRRGLALDERSPTQPSAPQGLGHIRGPGGRSLQEPGREVGVEAAVGRLL